MEEGPAAAWRVQGFRPGQPLHCQVRPHHCIRITYRPIALVYAFHFIQVLNPVPHFARINKTHTVLVGGYAHDFTTINRRGETLFTAGLSQQATWLYDGNYWEQLEDMSTTRDRPACSLVQLGDNSGQVGVLVAGGCARFCADSDNPPMRSAELLDVNSGSWTRVADLPRPISSGSMQLFDGVPTVIGGTDGVTQNGKMYQYFVEENVWREHPWASLRIPRSSAAVFEIPYNMFNDC